MGFDSLMQMSSNIIGRMVRDKKKIITAEKSKKSNKLDSFSKFIAIAVFTGLVLYLTAISNSIYFQKLQELSLFAPTKMFLFEKVRLPGGLLNYLGLFFTQFFYYPWLGSIILILFLFAVQFLTIKAFGFNQRLFPLSFIPSLLSLLAITQLGYYIYILY